MVDGPSPRFFWRGRARAARAGETALEALATDGLPALARSYRYHRPRGSFCGVGYCAGCLVRVNGVPNVRACRHPLVDGDRVRNTNGWPSARFDVFGTLDLLFPGGIDTLRGFRRPAFLAPVYQKVIRRLAGYGPLPDLSAVGTQPPPVRSLDRDVVVVGAGTSGRSTAAHLVERGVRPLVIDRGLRVAEIPGAELLARTDVTFLPAPGGEEGFRLVGFQEPDGGLTVRARTVVLATGSYDAGLLFADGERPGVFSAEGALAVGDAVRSRAFSRALVFGTGDRARRVLERLGDRVVALAAPDEIGPETVALASDQDIRLYPRTLLVRARGRRRVRSAGLRTRGGGPAFDLPCDAIILAHRRLPNAQLLFQAGARMGWRAGSAAYFPHVDGSLATSVPGLYAVGSVAGVLPGGSAESGVRAAEAVTGRPVGDAPLPWVRSDGPSELEGYYRELLPELRSGRSIVCPCEDVLLHEVEAAYARGYRGIEVIKRYTGLGTGLCQGRYCQPDAVLLLSILEGRPPSEVGTITQRPPVVPTPLGVLAGLDGPAGGTGGR